MKNLIILLTTLLLGITACNKSEEQILLNDEVIFEQLNQQLGNSSDVPHNLKQTANGNLPEVGDQIDILFGDGNYGKTYATVESIQSNNAAFTIKATTLYSTIYILAAKNQININVQDCSSSTSDFQFLSYKTAAFVDETFIADQGHYDWKDNGGCSLPGIPETGCWLLGCPFADPKIVLFQKNSNGVLYLNWD